jgi:hypothetical protein
LILSPLPCFSNHAKPLISRKTHLKNKVAKQTIFLDLRYGKQRA